MKAAVFFDIDNTILDHYTYVPESTIEGIRALRKKGHYAFICSGRSRAFIQDPRVLDIGFDGVVAGCGTHVEYQGEMLYEHLISVKDCYETLEMVYRYGFRPVLEGPEYLYFNLADFDENDPYGNLLRSDPNLQHTEIDAHEGKWRINKISCATEVDDETYAAGLKAFEKDYSRCIHNRHVVEFVPKGHTKATGIEVMCRHLGVDRANTFALGDSINDLEMLEYAGTGICMGNGYDEAKEKADYVTDTIRNDGVYKALKHFGLI